MKKSRIGPAKGLTIKLAEDGNLQASVSKASGDFALTLDVLELLCLLKQGIESDALATHLKTALAEVQKHLPSQKEINQIILDLREAGFIVDTAEHGMIKGIKDGFGDPWIQWAMLADSTRMKNYYGALKKVITNNSVVLDIGAGTGALSAFCLMLGAKKVYAVEETAMASTIVKIANHLRIADVTKRLKVINASIYEVNIPADTNVIVSELFGNDPFGEGLLPILQDVARKIHGGKIISVPKKLEVYGEFVHLTSGPIYPRVKALSALQESSRGEEDPAKFCSAARKVLDFSSLSFSTPLQAENFKRVTKAIKLGEWKLTPPTISGNLPSKNLEVKIPENIPTPVFIIWFKVYLDDAISISSFPNMSDSCEHWSPLVVPLLRGIKKQETLSISVDLADDGCMLNCKICSGSEVLGCR